MQKIKEGETVDDASAPRLTPSPFFFAPRFAGAFAALLLIVVAGSGTAYAAKGALPGDLLYSVKTNVNEPIEGALAFSTESKIEYQNGLAQNRLEEAEALASQNRLDSSTTQELESSIDTHLSQRDALAQSLDASDPGSSAAVVGELDSTIAAHGDVLAALGSESHSTTTRDNTDALATRARLAASSRGSMGGIMAMAAKTAAPMIPAGEAPHAALMMAPMDASATEATGSGSSTVSVSIESAPIVHPAMAKAVATGSAEAAAPTSTQTQGEKAAQALEDRATTSLQALEQSAGAASKSVKADVAAKLTARLAKISALVASGQAALQSGDFDAAKDDFSRALDRSATLSTFIAANARFDSGILGQLLDNSSDDDAGD
ncbi:MAG TPA: DUF5667 domain-containing protein [Candidatus Paceibacterota bacterium]|nr:DUF5667 domain-containing protein [Candidatus Paceibacterota bacterium]